MLNDFLEKYSISTIKNFDKDNFNKIIIFLKNEGCECIEDIVEDYLDVFLIEYEEFKRKYFILNKKYNNQYLKMIVEDMNYLEEMFNNL